MAPAQPTPREPDAGEERERTGSSQAHERPRTDPRANERRYDRAGHGGDRPSQAEIDADPEAQAGPETS